MLFIQRLDMNNIDLYSFTCIDCKFFTKTVSFYGTCAKDVNTTKSQDEWLSNIEFLCNRFEKKDKYIAIEKEIIQ